MVSSSSTRKDPTDTPAMRQWTEQKAQAGEAILLFRMGDFYETFFDDAKTVSRELGLTLTARNKGVNPIPLAGIPYHALDNYLIKLVRAGFTVAISEQTEDPKQAKGVVQRDIVRVVTPGTLTDDHLLEDNASNYLVAVCAEGTTCGAAVLDLAAGTFFTLDGQAGDLLEHLTRLAPAELLIEEGHDEPLSGIAADLAQLCSARLACRAPHEFDPFHAERLLLKQFDVSTMEGFGYSGMTPALRAAGAILGYLNETQKGQSTHVVKITPRDSDRCVHIDPNTWRALEVERTVRTGQTDGTLFAALNRCSTSMGARRLRDALRFPLTDLREIKSRQEAVAALVHDGPRCTTIRQHLRGLCDIERVTGRLGVGRCSPRDMLGLGRSLEALLGVANELASDDAGALQALRAPLRQGQSLSEFLLGALHEDAPLTVREGGIIAPGFDAELDRLRDIGRDGQRWLAEYQAQEIERTHIPSLKVGYNRVFGYYIEVTHTHRDAVPSDYVRKQTLKGAERYITDALKTYETEVLTARDKANELEYALFGQILERACAEIPQLIQTGTAAALLDLLCGFAVIATERRYVCPQFETADTLSITAGRHPVLDLTLDTDLVPNDVEFSVSGGRLHVITGPNMAGKSTFIRQVALLSLLAHTGSFVPAEAMHLSAVDRIFARVGASDEISRGQSTFMVEMVEAANILHNATARSLVVLDELGRGTSTYDGLALAWAICEHLDRIGCKTLFATHYHELTELGHLRDGVRNYNVAVREWPADSGQTGRIVFLHSIVSGATDKSYGLHVAQLAGVPADIVARGRNVLEQLESSLSRRSLRDTLSAGVESPSDQLELFATQDDLLRQALLAIDLDQMTPLDALLKLKKLQEDAR